MQTFFLPVARRLIGRRDAVHLRSEHAGVVGARELLAHRRRAALARVVLHCTQLGVIPPVQKPVMQGWSVFVNWTPPMHPMH